MFWSIESLQFGLWTGAKMQNGHSKIVLVPVVSIYMCRPIIHLEMTLYPGLLVYTYLLSWGHAPVIAVVPVLVWNSTQLAYKTILLL